MSDLEEAPTTLLTEEKKAEERTVREEELQVALSELGLTLREDSTLCRNYIEYGDKADISNVDLIAHRMAETRYLHEYCNFNLGYNLARGVIRYLNGPMPPPQWQETIRQCVLLTSNAGEFPPSWPWLQGLSPQEWRQEFDKTTRITSPTVPAAFYSPY